MFTFVVAEEWPDSSSRAVMDGLLAFNAAHGVTPSELQLAITVTGERARVVGGLLARLNHGWLYVAWLWVSDEHRGRGLGTQLVERAERLAVERGCHHAHLTTLEFQSRAFYERLGYQVFGVLEDYPAPHRRYFLQKALAR